jgi:hypothetical protein
MFDRCITVEGNKQAERIGAKLSRQLTTIAVQMTDLQIKVSASKYQSTEVNTETELDIITLIGGEQENKQQTQHMEQYLSTVNVIYANATEYNGSVAGTVIGDETDVADITETFGSDHGLDDDQRLRVHEWRRHSEHLSEGMYLDFSLQATQIFTMLS